MRLPFTDKRLPFLQELIHKFEEGGGIRYLRWVTAILLLVILVVVYNARAFQNFGTIEAMDCAQLARNFSEGKGFSTSFIRPLSIYLVKKWNVEHKRYTSDEAQLNGNHPDIANPPAYPVILAGLMKVLPFRYKADVPGEFWSRAFQPDFLIALFNQLLFVALVFLVYKLAKRLFDSEVAWVSALALLGTELLWRFSTSGISTMMLMLILAGLAWMLVVREEWGRDENCGSGKLLSMGVVIGALAGLGALTRYSFAFVIVPVVLVLVLFAGRLRAQTVLCTLAAFVFVITPWLARNYYVSGKPLGVTSYASVANTGGAFSGNQLERSLQPPLFVSALPKRLLFKLSSNVPPIIENDLPTLGGTWISAFFLVGLLVGYKREGPRRFRYFLLACLLVFMLVQALGRTYLSDDTAGLNTENQLVLFTPFVIVFGVSLFLLLLDQVQLAAFELRYVIIGLFLIVCSLPFVLALCSRTVPDRVTAPYFPKFIQVAVAEVREKELTMSDIPWAMAWYGRRDCVWLTLNPMPPVDEPSKEDVPAVNDWLKPLAELYLSPVTLDRKLISGEKGWSEFVANVLVKRELPDKFPLSTSLQSMDMARQGHLVLTASDLHFRENKR